MDEAAEYRELVVESKIGDSERYFYNSQCDDRFATDTVGASVTPLNLEDLERIATLHQLFAHARPESAGIN